MSDAVLPCPICSSAVQLPQNAVETEIFSCNTCGNRLVIVKIVKNAVTLAEAPIIEEDWGQ